MIHANLTLREKIHYASIGEYELTPEDMAERSSEDCDEARESGFEHGMNVIREENEPIYREIMELAEEIMDELPPSGNQAIIDRVKKIIELCH